MIGRLWPYFVGTVALGLDAYVIAGMLPEIASDLGSGPGTVGLGVAAFTAAYAISGPRRCCWQAGRSVTPSSAVPLRGVEHHLRIGDDSCSFYRVTASCRCCGRCLLSTVVCGGRTQCFG